MSKTLEQILTTSSKVFSAAHYPATPCWNHMIPGIEQMSEPFWGRGREPVSSDRELLILSGAGRNGNHLVHSMLDGHSALHRLCGEDSFISAFFNDLVHDYRGALCCLQGIDNINYILKLSGYGHNKWEKLSRMFRGDNIQKTEVWAGVQEKHEFVTDYQDTVVRINYEAYLDYLHQVSGAIRKAETFMDILWYYMNALMRLDPDFEEKSAKKSVFMASGLRGELDYLLGQSDNIIAVTPIRPFESYYFSHAKSKSGHFEISQEVIDEAWNYWSCKSGDYLLLKKRFKDKICLVNFSNLIRSPEESAREICRFLHIEFENTCLKPTIMGVPSKGNSSFPKSENERGLFYQSSISKILPREFLPERYPEMWELVEGLAI